MATGHNGIRGCVIVIIFAVLRSGVSESNVAIFGTAQQSSNQDNTRWLAEQAVDNCAQTTIASGCCSHTNAKGQNTAWWRVDLGMLITINAITIYYRNNAQYRLAGYQLYVSNTSSSPPDGVLCYEDTSTTLEVVQLTITHQCPYVGRYVTVYNYRYTPIRHEWYYGFAVLELCEVQVWGCQIGTYGDGNCDRACPGNCEGGNCNATTGACFYCFTGSYDDFCNKTCPLSCKNSKCEKGSGNCYDCIAQKHGVQCEHDCSIDCKDRLCDKDSGHCYDCNAHKHGVQCKHDCSIDCKDRLCDKDTGHCYECVAGRYGATCEVYCDGSCKNKCDKVTGNCIECVDGRHGLKCELDCPTNCKVNCDQVTANCLGCVPQKYGAKCEQNCSASCKGNICEKENGTCNECVAGKFGDICDQDCPGSCKDMLCETISGNCIDCIPQKYGVKCEQNCSTSCKGKLCTKETGKCTGCATGLYGPNCTMACIANCTECDRNTGECKKCNNRLYGKTCNKTCGHCITCDIDSGFCVSPCDADYEGKFCRKSKLQDAETPSVDAGPIAGAVVAILVVAVVAIVVVIFIRRRQANGGKQKPYSDVNQQNIYSEPHDTEDQGYQGAQKGRNDPDVEENPTNSSNVYLNIEQVPRKSAPSDTDYYNHDSVGSFVSRLKSMVEKKLQNKAKAFEDEYKSLSSGALHKHDIGKMEHNKAKNRFKTTFPYDHSRVVLKTVGNDSYSDYINANYIDSVTKPAEYVATQGPRPGTVNDFWRMIWQLNTGKIVMLTNLVEGGRPKCDKYWPDEGQPLVTTHYNIILDRERSYAFYVIRDLKVTEKKTKSVRQIHQFHYTSWPDHGTPDPIELVLFHRRVKNYEATLKGEMVVHCSAGIGRTGTFLALDALLIYGQETERIDVLEYIKTMRKDRVNMVQTAEQYIAVHQLLVEAFEMPDTLIPRMKFHTELKVLMNGGAANQTKLRREYQLTQSSKPCYHEENYKAALLTSNKRKNRFMTVLAVDEFRVYLLSHTNGRTDYINAVSVPSYTSKTGYIVTQTPLEDTVVDLLTMIMDHHCHTLVIIETDPIDWLPGSDEDMSIGDFRLEYKGESSTVADVDVYDIAIESAVKGSNTTVRVYHMTGWDRDSSVPKNSSVLLQLMELVDSRRKSDDTKTTVVMCRDGYSQSGLFCCISNARDQMKCDEEVDIYQISRQLLVRRPEFITNFDQYQYCYNTIKDYLDTTDIYVN